MSLFVLPETVLAVTQTPSVGEKSKVRSSKTAEFDQILEKNCAGENCFPDGGSALGGSEVVLANYRLLCPSIEGSSDPKPTSSCQSNNCSLSSSACSQSVSLLDGRLAQIQQGIDSFLSELQSFNFSLDWGEKGKLELVGQTGESGEFEFQLSGKKEVIVDLLTRAFEYLLTLEKSYGSAPTSANPCSLEGNGCPLPQGTGQTLITSTGEAESTLTGAALDNPSPLLETEGVALGSTPTETIAVEVAPAEADEALTSTLSEAPLAEAQPLAPEPEAPSSVLTEDGGSLSFSSGKNGQPEFTLAETAKASGGGDNLLFSDKEITTEVGKEVEPEPVVGESSPLSSKEGVELVFSLDSPADNASRLEKVQALFDRIFELAAREEGPKKLVIKLEPESLGSIVVQVVEEGKRVQCFWQIADPKTQELIEQNLPLLEARLGNEGMSFQNFLGEERGYWREEQAEFLSAVGNGKLSPGLDSANLADLTLPFNWSDHPGQINLLV